jgi:dihydrofolate reductase
MTVNAILAHDEQYGIGKESKLPWPHNDADMKWFRDCTNGHVVIMGRKTWESLGSKKLPNRTNIVVTRSELQGNPDGTYFGEIRKLVQMLKMEYPDLKIWIIGGADIYKQALSFCDNIYVTKFQGNYDCDAFVPMDEYLVDYKQMAVKTVKDLEFSIWSRI